MTERMNVAQHILMLCVRLYQLVLSPAKIFLFGNAGQCRFSPSCSQYTLEALSRHGAVKGTWLSVKRVCRCHPWGGCGCDPVPEKQSKVQSRFGIGLSQTRSPQSTVSSPDPLFTFHVSRFTSVTRVDALERNSKCHPAPLSR